MRNSGTRERKLWKSKQNRKPFLQDIYSMSEYNIVTKYSINQKFKTKSKYYQINLGYSSTTETNSGDRILNDKDDFAYFYNTRYKTTVQAQGKIGDISFYTDHYILDDKIAFYVDRDEFIFDFDPKIVDEKGVDFYLGHLLKKIHTEQERLSDEKNQKERKEEEKKNLGTPDKLSINPGNVTYADLKAYLDKKNSERLQS